MLSFLFFGNTHLLDIYSVSLLVNFVQKLAKSSQEERYHWYCHSYV